MPFFSIIIPVYKTEAYLENCIESIRRQSYADFELILVDDGSPDNCPKICDNYKTMDKRIVVIHKENGGVSSARNCGIEVAKGKYIWFVDSDDYVEPFSLERIYLAHKKENADIYFFNIHGESTACCNTFDAFLQNYYFKYVVGFAPWNKIYRTDIIKKNMLYFDEQETIGEDLLFNLAYYNVLFRKGERKLFFINQDYYCYVNRENSAMNAASKKRIVQQMRLFDKESVMLRSSLSDNSMTYLFWLHLISGINQSAVGGLTSRDLAENVDCKKYKHWIMSFKNIKNDFFSNEHATLLGKMRILLFQFMLNLGWIKLAGKIIGLY